MFNSKLKAELQQCQEQLLAQQGFFDAVHGSVATITFTPDGTVLAANDLFLNVVGFSAPEVVGHHHRMFCDPQYAQSSAYQQFWADLKQGRSRTGVFQRFTKGGEATWREATYFPDKLRGVVTKVIKIAADITEHHLQLLSELAQMFSDRGFREQLLSAPDALAAHALFAQWGSDAPDDSSAAV